VQGVLVREGISANYKLENRGSFLVATGQREFPIRKRRRRVEI